MLRTKNGIFPFRDNSKGKTITFVLSMEDEPGLLSVVLKKVAEFKANILTIHQTIPVNGLPFLISTLRSHQVSLQHLIQFRKRLYTI